MTHLFDPITLHGVEIRNRAWVSPMCMYSCTGEPGVVGGWHLGHYGSYAHGGFGLIVTEATAVNPQGRISLQDAGLWSDAQTNAWRQVVDVVHAQPIGDFNTRALPTRIAVQLAHAGRKASTYRNFPGETHDTAAVPVSDGGWVPVGPSPLAFSANYSQPAELDQAGIDAIIADFVASARRAADAGFDAVEVHMAHGYLLHEFLSPLSNQRTDQYGGSLENRMRLGLQIVQSVRQAWDGLLLVRISATDWHTGGWDVSDSVVLAKELRERGADLVDCSSGGNLTVSIPVGPGYQVPLAAQVRAEAGVPTGAVGLITEPQQADQVIDSGAADVVLLGRAALREPSWPQRAAHELGLAIEQSPFPPQTMRGAW